jgi:hypothetical protein
MASANTNPIGGGTCNLSVNMLDGERSILGKLACREGISTGQLVRRLIGEGLTIEDPDLAKRYQAARVQRYVRNISMVVTTSIVLWQSIISNQDMVRKLPTSRLAQPRKEQVQ